MQPVTSGSASSALRWADQLCQHRQLHLDCHTLCQNNLGNADLASLKLTELKSNIKKKYIYNLGTLIFCFQGLSSLSMEMLIEIPLITFNF